MLPDLTAVPVHDVAACMEMLDGDQELFDELMELYSASASQTLQDMDEALAAGDRTGLAGAAHSLKGSSANLCIERIRSLSCELEQRARRDDGVELSPFVAAIKVEFNSFLQQVAQTS